MKDALLASLPAAIDDWSTTDSVLADLARRYPPHELPVEVLGDGFASLAQAIIHQQVSLAAGRTIHGRFVAAVGGVVVPSAVLEAGEVVLRGAGLSGQKASYILDLAAQTESGELDFDGFSGMSDQMIIASLTRVRGIGTWTAKMHLLFHLQRPDVCPWEDLGVRLAVERFYGVPEKRAASWLRDEACLRWRPHNSLAARVLWHAKGVVELEGG